MEYFLFKNHLKEELKVISEEKREKVKRYFEGRETIISLGTILGKNYVLVFDVEAFGEYANFDCFNCRESCCGDAPGIFNNLSREFILDNLDEFDQFTKVPSILNSLGYEDWEVEKMIKNDPLLVKDELIPREVDLCPCSFRPENKKTLCGLHSMALEKKMDGKSIIDLKPLICSLWPLEIFHETLEGKEVLYITLPNDFNNEFTIEDYYMRSCINIDYGLSPQFKRLNPEGFKDEDYQPFVFAYETTLRTIFGGEVIDKIIEKLKEKYFLEDKEDFQEQINKNIM